MKVKDLLDTNSMFVDTYCLYLADELIEFAREDENKLRFMVGNHKVEQFWVEDVKKNEDGEIWCKLYIELEEE